MTRTSRLPGNALETRRFVAAVTAAWAFAAAVLLLADPGEDRGWWVWSCVAGVVVGLIGLAVLPRRDQPLS